MPKINYKKKREVYQLAKKILMDRYPGRIESPGGACLFWSMSAIEAVGRLLKGTRIIVQAGTCYWPRLTKEQYDATDEKEYSHFGFEWHPGSRVSIESVLAGNLPEMHIWAAITGDDPHIVDFSTGDLTRLCRNMLGKDWPGTEPPEFFWGRAKDCKRHNVIYKPHPNAIKTAESYINLIK